MESELIKKIREEYLTLETFTNPLYHPRKREDFIKKGELDISEIYKSLDKQYMEFSIAKMVVELSLNENEIRSIIEERFIQCYSNTDIELNGDRELIKSVVKNSYPEWCKKFFVEPNQNFIQDFWLYNVMNKHM